MLNHKGFDLWADGYDRSVGLSDECGVYPFAGYRNILNEIYCRILSRSQKSVLDIGFGTGTLAVKLYEQGRYVYGQDFSEKMVRLAQSKMPEAKLYQGDFSLGLVDELKRNKYDAIIATYSMHHLNDTQKISFIEKLILLLNDSGSIYIGDVAFKTRIELEECMLRTGDEWDEEEIYFVFDEIKRAFPKMKFSPFSYCSGLLYLDI